MGNTIKELMNHEKLRVPENVGTGRIRERDGKNRGITVWNALSVLWNNLFIFFNKCFL